MKFAAQFRSFLSDTVNLDASRLANLERSVDAITAVLENDDELGDLVKSTHRQGSWAHGTIIRPQTGREFDADIMVELARQDGWEPKDYLNAIHAALSRTGKYSGKLIRKKRCIRVVYANDYHVDLVAYVDDAGRGGIVNRIANEFEATDPLGFTEWYRGRNQTTNGHLKRVVRLVKHLRDIKGTFSIPSVILTTLLGERVSHAKGALGDYDDLPTALRTLMEDLAGFLDQHASQPTVHDPTDTEHQRTFNHRWDPNTYANLVTRIRYYADKIAAAHEEDDRAASMALWREVFGDSFGTDLQQEMAALASVRKSAVVGAPGEQFIDQPPFGFPVLDSTPYEATITGRVRPRDGFRSGDLSDMRYQVHRGRDLVFTLEHNVTGAPVEVYWKVRNRGDEARANNGLRGEIRRDPNGMRRITEATKWRGDHFVEAYVVQGGQCVAVARCPVTII